MDKLQLVIEAGLISNFKKKLLHPNTAKNLIRGIENRLKFHSHEMPEHAIHGHIKAIKKLKSHIRRHTQD
jgi:hypothetical protein